MKSSNHWTNFSLIESQVCSVIACITFQLNSVLRMQWPQEWKYSMGRRRHTCNLFVFCSFGWKESPLAIVACRQEAVLVHVSIYLAELRFSLALPSGEMEVRTVRGVESCTHLRHHSEFWLRAWPNQWEMSKSQIFLSKVIVSGVTLRTHAHAMLPPSIFFRCYYVPVLPSWKDCPKAWIRSVVVAIPCQ